MDPPPADPPNNTGIAEEQQVFYTAAERAIIAPFRKAYLNTTTPAQRKYIATRQILPALFDYWEANDPNDPRITNVKQSSTVSSYTWHAYLPELIGHGRIF